MFFSYYNFLQIYFSHAQVHSKLRNGATKGRGASRTTSGSTSTTNTTTTTTSSSSGSGGGATPSTSPTAFLPPRGEKRKSKDESPSPVNGDNTDPATQSVANASGIPISASGGSLATQPQSLLNPMTGLNVQINTKKCKTASPCAISPVLLECPEQDCGKKYKHANGLRYHQSHAHGSSGSMDEDSMQMPDEPISSPSPGPAIAEGKEAVISEVAVKTESATSATAESVAAPLSPASSAAAVDGNNATLPASTVSATAAQATTQPTAALVQVPSPAAAVNADVPTSTAAAGNGTLITAVPATVSVAASASSVSLLTTSASASSQALPPLPSLLTPAGSAAAIPHAHPVAGGSITAGISGQALSQQQQQIGLVSSAAAAANALPPLLSEQQALLQQQQQQAALKPGVLRFGPPNEASSGSMHNLQSQQSPQQLTTNVLPSQSPLRPGSQIATGAESLPPASYAAAAGGISSPSMANKSASSFTSAAAAAAAASKNKKNRKSPVPGEFEGAMSRDGVQSPAYSDISDDSTPVADQEMLDKSQPSKHIDLLSKKPGEVGVLAPGGLPGAPPNMPPGLSSYGMYQFYQQQQYMVPPPTDAQQAAKGSLPAGVLGQTPLSLASNSSQQQQQQPGAPPPPHHLPQQTSPHMADYSQKNKDPPLDLMTKPSSGQMETAGSKDSASQPPPVNLSAMGGPTAGLPPTLAGLGAGLGPGGLPNPTAAKPMSHFYPFK